MKLTKPNLAISAVVSSLIILGAGGAINPAQAGGHGDKEKCYGVVKAGKNDCATKSSSCAGTSKEDGQKDAFVVVPKGLCDKLVGSSKTSA